MEGKWRLLIPDAVETLLKPRRETGRREPHFFKLLLKYLTYGDFFSDSSGKGNNIIKGGMAQKIKNK